MNIGSRVLASAGVALVLGGVGAELAQAAPAAKWWIAACTVSTAYQDGTVKNTVFRLARPSQSELADAVKQWESNVRSGYVKDRRSVSFPGCTYTTQ